MKSLLAISISSPPLLHQALLMASLARGSSRLAEVQLDASTHALIENLLALGVAIVVDESTKGGKSTATIDVAGTGGYWPNSDAELHANGDFSLACFLIAACSLGRGRYSIYPGRAVSDAELVPFLNALTDLGTAIHHERTDDEMLINLGPTPLRGGRLECGQNFSPLALSSLLLVAPYAITDVLIRIAAIYDLRDTVNLMDQFGVTVIVEPSAIIVPALQCYRPL